MNLLHNIGVGHIIKKVFMLPRIIYPCNELVLDNKKSPVICFRL